MIPTLRRAIERLEQLPVNLADSTVAVGAAIRDLRAVLSALESAPGDAEEFAREIIALPFVRGDTFTAKLIELIRARDAKREADRWIPCSGRMPPEGETVLAVVVDHGVRVATYHRQIGSTPDSDVTHWRPLPPPPEPTNG